MTTSLDQTFEHIILQAGGFGRWNCLLLLQTFLASVMATFGHLSIIFTGFSPDFTVSNYSDFTSNCSEVSNTSSIMFDEMIFSNTIVTEYQLICERTVLLSVITFSYMSSIAVSNLFVGALSDSCGRRKLILVTSVVHSVACLVTWLREAFRKIFNLIEFSIRAFYTPILLFFWFLERIILNFFFGF